MTIYDLLRQVGPDDVYYYNKETNEVTDTRSLYKRYFKEHPNETRIPILNNLCKLPTYEELDHKGIMSYFVKEIVENKSIRKELFDILRYHDYMDKFYDALKKYNLYEEYCNMSDDFFCQIIDEWKIKNDIH